MLENNLQNEYVTNRLASSNDTWSHTKDIRALMWSSEARVREATPQEAAQLAAYYSQAKESSGVPVDYTLIRHVRKPNGAKPGFVIYDNQNAVRHAGRAPDQGDAQFSKTIAIKMSKELDISFV